MKIATVVTFLPEHFFILFNDLARIIPCLGFKLVECWGTGRCYGCACKLDSDGSLSGLGIVIFGSQPCQIRDLQDLLVNIKHDQDM